MRNEGSKARQPVETMRMNYQRSQFESGSYIREDSFAATFPPRRFAPQLIETARRSFRKDTSYDRYHSGPPESQAKHTNIDTTDRFSFSSLPRRNTQRCPSNVASSFSEINFEYSEVSNCLGLPSLSSSASTNDSISHPDFEEQRRESCDEQFSEYLLSLAARSAGRQLGEQMLAAFPDEQAYQSIENPPIHENYNERPVPYTEKKRPATSHNQSSDDLSRMHQHICRRHMGEAKSMGRAIIEPKERVTSTDQQIIDTAHGDTDGGWQNDATVKCPASPPLLGNDIIFPRSLSPEKTIYEIGSASRHQRRNLDQPYRGNGGLWSANLNVGDNSFDGLWMGTCHRASEHDGNLHELSLSGSITPIRDHREESPASSDDYVTSERGDRHPSDASIEFECTGDVGRNHNPQDEPDNEFHDGFVTQIYNYLSLGYPCIAHCYDHELSRISSIPVHDLRQDDLHIDSRGYVSVIEGTVGNIWPTGHTCMRWLALRLYIQEWARQQQPLVAEDDSDIIEAWCMCE